jgi:hypothetical protein
MAFVREKRARWSPLTVEKKKQEVVRAGLLLWILLLLFPPFYRAEHGGSAYSREWGFFVRFDSGSVDVSLLFLELLLVGVVAGVCYHTLTQRAAFY